MHVGLKAISLEILSRLLLKALRAEVSYKQSTALISITMKTKFYFYNELLII